MVLRATIKITTATEDIMTNTTMTGAPTAILNRVIHLMSRTCPTLMLHLEVAALWTCRCRRVRLSRQEDPAELPS